MELLEIISENSKDAGAREEINNLSGFFQENKSPEFVLKILKLKTAEEKSLARKRHDLKGAFRTLRYALEAIKDGYKFDDEKAEAKVKSMERALEIIGQEELLLENIYSNTF